MCCMLNRLIASAEAAALLSHCSYTQTPINGRNCKKIKPKRRHQIERIVSVFNALQPPYHIICGGLTPSAGEAGTPPAPHASSSVLACIWQRTHVLQPHKCASINYLHWKHIANKMQMARKCLFSEVCLESSSTQIINT